MSEIEQDDEIISDKNLEENNSEYDEILNKDLSPRLARLKKNALSKKNIPGKQIRRFLAAVFLDEERPDSEKIDLLELFNIWLEKGNKNWLDPCHCENGIAKIDEVLLKFAGKREILKPFIKILVDLAKEGISPSSFTKYVIFPRLSQDNNWRKWNENHLEPLQIIARLIKEMMLNPPFNNEYLGTEKYRLTKDVVLVKYIGQPLALFNKEILENSDLLKKYKEAWEKITLDNTFSIYFMRRNILHFIYIMSGKIDLIQLCILIEQMPEIENAFGRNYPEGFFNIDNDTTDISLFDYDIYKSVEQRKERGYKNFDFIIEIRAYLEILKALLNTRSGVYLCAYYAKLLITYKDPIIANTISRLVEVLYDNGGMHIYKWHTRKLLDMTKISFPDYIKLIEDHKGIDPDYPNIYRLFRNVENENEETEAERLGQILGLNPEDFVEDALDGINDILTRFSGIDQKRHISYKDVIEGYIKQSPQSESLIRDYQKQFFQGYDRNWELDFIKDLDGLDGKMHKILLKSVIRGIGQGFALKNKSSSFQEIYSKYNSVNKQTYINKNINFKIPVKGINNINKFKEEEIRKQINFTLIEKIWYAINYEEKPLYNNIKPFINDFSINLNEPIKRINDFINQKEIEKKSLKDKLGLQDTINVSEIEEITKNITDIEKTINKNKKSLESVIKSKENYDKVLDVFDNYNDIQKLFVGLFIASYNSNINIDFLTLMIRLLLERYKEEEKSKIDEERGLENRLYFIKSDISINILSYKQFNYILNTIEYLINLVHHDRQFLQIINNFEDEANYSEIRVRINTSLKESLKPFILTRNKAVDLESFDAAIKSIFGYAKLLQEKAKWQDLLEKIDGEEAKYFRSFSLYISKSFMDSYYGDMGGICLSGKPYLIKDGKFFNVRLVEINEKQIVGMALMYLSVSGIEDYPGTPKFWIVFAINPLHSLLQHMSISQQLTLYLNYRKVFEYISWFTKLPVVLASGNSYGIISNDSGFTDIIVNYEKKNSIRVRKAKSDLGILNNGEDYVTGSVIIEPREFKYLTKNDLSSFGDSKETIWDLLIENKFIHNKNGQGIITPEVLNNIDFFRKTEDGINYIKLYRLLLSKLPSSFYATKSIY